MLFSTCVLSFSVYFLTTLFVIPPFNIPFCYCPSCFRQLFPLFPDTDLFTFSSFVYINFLATFQSLPLIYPVPTLITTTSVCFFFYIFLPTIFSLLSVIPLASNHFCCLSFTTVIQFDRILSVLSLVIRLSI